MKFGKNKLGKIHIEGQSENVVSKAIMAEMTPYIVIVIAMVIGMVIFILDIRDNGMLLDIKIKDMSLSYTGTCVGLVVFILACIALIYRKTDITIKNTPSSNSK